MPLRGCRIMREGFLTGLHRSWFAWSGWLFTVAGTVFGLSVSGAYAWILCSDGGLEMVYTKVARIISDTDLILAAGSEDGVKEGTEFVIFQLGEPIPDPETGESLGELELVKGRVVATHVQP